jgi:hypothetical protein
MTRRTAGSTQPSQRERRLERRILTVLEEAPIGAVVEVRTTDAFAARFRAEADRSGLEVDLETRSSEEMVRLCPQCGAQNGRLDTTCFNCQTELDAVKDAVRMTEAKRRAWLEVVLEGRAPEARYLRIFASPTVSIAPLIKVPVSRERFNPPPPPEKPLVERFLSLFIHQG